MSSVLRRYGRVAGQHLRATPALAPRSAAATCCHCLRRPYASESKPKREKVSKASPTPKRDGQGNSVPKPTSADRPDRPAKPAPGMQDLYSQPSPLNKAAAKDPESATQKDVQADQPAGDAHSDAPKPPLPPGWVWMTKREEALLEKMLLSEPILVLGLKKQDLVDQLEHMKKSGVPVELRELLKDPDAPMSITKLVKITQVVWKTHVPTASPTGPKQSVSSPPPPPPPSGSSGKANKSSGNTKKDMTFKFDVQYFMISAFTAYLGYRLVFPGENSKEISYQEFRSTLLEKGLVEKLTVERHTVRVDVNHEAVRSVYPDSPAVRDNFHYTFSIGSVEAFERNIDAVQAELNIPLSERIPVTYATTSPSDFWSLLINFGPSILLIGGLYWATKGAAGRGGGAGPGGIFGMMKSRAKQFNHETDVKVKFKDVAGMDEAKLEIMEFVSFLKTPEKFERLGAKIPRGAILSGPPGTGKTLLAKATAGESSVPFFSVSGSEFVEMFVGVGASRVRDLFAMARKSTPCIIFIDEIDAIGKSRGKNQFGGNDEREATLNQILTEMDGFNTSEQIVVLAGTNRPDVLDQALMRPGRFDRHIAIDRPTMEGRKQIFAVHLQKVVTKEDMEHLTGRLSALTPGFSGADIANCVNEAALIAARSSAQSVEMVHFEQAIERVVGGLEKKSLVLSAEERRTVAYHEAGHAICGWYFEHADPLLKVSIIPRGQGALGYAQYLPNSDVYLMNVNQLMDRMAMTLGGRISEEIHFPVVTSGASDDFNKVTRMATAMVTKWGMSKKLGPLHFEDDDNKLHKPFAEATAQMIDSEVSRIVHEAYTKCKDLLLEKKTQIGLVAEELLRKEMLDRNDMVRLLGKRPFESHKEFEKYFGGQTGEKSAPPPPPTEGHPVIEGGGSMAI